ncbi:hypothetical protein ACQR35_13305 [Pseudarthrobacter sp. J1738]|uniref:hypothetical protein n=1 Tax=Pseudarthrobacter sp. J1738 TaxID=3420446 RepID=UPI003D27D452
MSSDQSREASAFHDPRDLTPFRGVQIHVPLLSVPGALGERIANASRRYRIRPLSPGVAPRLKPLTPRPVKHIHAAIFSGAEPERLITLARTYPGWAGLCYVMAGLQAYQMRQFPQAAELLRRGINTVNDDDAGRYIAENLMQLLTQVELGDGVSVRVLFSEEAVMLALAHSLDEIGEPEAALEVLEPLPASLAKVLAISQIAASLERHDLVIGLSDGLRNVDDLAAAILLLRARSLRAVGRLKDTEAAIAEILRRKRTSLLLRNAAMTERALLVLDAGWKALPRRRPRPIDRKLRPGGKAEQQEWMRAYRNKSGK